MRRTLLPATLVATAPPVASADWPDSIRYDNVCDASTLLTCASIWVATSPLPGGGTRLELRLRNLQGQHPLVPRGQPQLIDFLAFGSRTTRLRDPYAGPIPPGGHAYQYALGSVFGSPDAIDSGWEPEGIEELQFFPSVYGCDAPPGWHDPSTGGWQTCAPAGFGGWAVYGFVLGNVTTAADIYVNLGVNGQGRCSVGNGGYGVKCRFVDPGTTVVPEPSTVALLGSGLMGIALARWARRRGQGRADSEPASAARH
jgi:hypothetical protein